MDMKVAIHEALKKASDTIYKNNIAAALEQLRVALDDAAASGLIKPELAELHLGKILKKVEDLAGDLVI
jgi:hypothetical protein